MYTRIYICLWMDGWEKLGYFFSSLTLLVYDTFCRFLFYAFDNAYTRTSYPLGAVRIEQVRKAPGTYIEART